MIKVTDFAFGRLRAPDLDLLGALDQHVVEVLVEAGFDDQDMRHQASPGMGRSPTIDRP